MTAPQSLRVTVDESSAEPDARVVRDADGRTLGGPLAAAAGSAA